MNQESGGSSIVAQRRREAIEPSLSLHNLVGLVYEAGDRRASTVSNAYGRLGKVTIAVVGELALCAVVRGGRTLQPSSIRYRWDSRRRGRGGATEVEMDEIAILCDV